MMLAAHESASHLKIHANAVHFDRVLPPDVAVAITGA